MLTAAAGSEALADSAARLDVICRDVVAFSFTDMQLQFLSLPADVQARIVRQMHVEYTRVRGQDPAPDARVIRLVPKVTTDADVEWAALGKRLLPAERAEVRYLAECLVKARRYRSSR